MTNPARTWFVVLALAFVAAAHAQLSYTGGTYTQNFNTLPADKTVTYSFTGVGPFALDAAPVNASGLAGWTFAKTGTTGNATFIVGNGSTNTGATYSYGSDGSADRALGSVASGTVTPLYGLTLVNDTGTTVTSFTLSYTGEQWRHGGAAGIANTLTFDYKIDALSIKDTGFTAAPAFNFSGPITAGASAVTLDGNAAANRQAISSTITGLNWGPGQKLTLRWNDRDDSGSDDGIAIDDLSFSTNVGPGGASPAVTTTSPTNGAVNVPVGNTLSVTFNLAVNVSASSFTVNGSLSGAHSVVVAGGPKTYTLTPSPVFAEAETVTVAVLASQVTDVATGARHPDADATFSFTTLSTAPTPIHTVQGSGTGSPYVGQLVTVQGVVTASFQGGSGLGGFYVQSAEADYDADPTTSEGIFVFNNSFSVTAGDLVKVTGTVAEFGTAPVTQTEVTSVTALTKLGTAPLPTPIAVSLPFATTTTAEAYEGMRVTLPQALTVTDNFDLGHFGEFILSNGRLQTPTNIVSPGAPAVAQSNANFLNQILVDDGVSASYPNPTPFLDDSGGRGVTRRTGSTVTGLAGILDEKFGSYIVEPTEPVAFTDANPRGNPPAVGGSLHVAIGNVLNYFNGDGAGGGFPTARGADTLVEFQRQRAKVIAGIVTVAPDIMGLTELENDGFGSTSAIADLVSGLNAAAPAGTTYAFVNTEAVDGTTDLIHSGFIYRTETVEPVGAPAALNNAYFLGIARSPLAQTFREKATGEKLTVCINHFRAKGSAASSAASTDGITPNPNLDTNDGQATNKYVRTREAQTLVNWLATDPTGSGDADFLIIGDLNSYAKEDPIVAIEGAGYTNLTETYEGAGGYSYAFAAEFGHLDHALANAHLTAQVTGAGTWHVNSDEPVYYDYNTENKAASQLTINVDGAYRYSDHDPVLIGLNLHPDPSAPTITTQPLSQTVTAGDSVTFTAAASGYPAPTYQWQKGGVDLPGQTAPTLTLSNVTTAAAGSYTLVATNGSGTATSNPAILTVNKASATVTLGAASFVYDGSPKTASATTTPSGLNVLFTYDGSATAPTNAGTYAVAAAIDDPNYEGSATGTLVISSAAAHVALSNLVQSYNGTPRNASVTTTPSGLPVAVTYNGTATAPTHAGSYAVVATVTDPNYTGSASGTLVINDTGAPVISSLTASPAVLWPVNHKMVGVTITAVVADDVDGAPITKIVAVSCNEPSNGAGDGNTPADWQITGALTLNLRAERAGNAGDRIYTITVESRDHSGNASTRNVSVTVPHNQ
jgi:predicted extracellular nuclease